MAEQSYSVAIGRDGDHWFIGVQPPLSEELMHSSGLTAMRGWAIEQDIPDATVFRKHTAASHEATLTAADSLTMQLAMLGHTCVVGDTKPVDMKGRVTPFTY